MTNTTSPDSGFRTESVLLIESSFQRINKVVFGKTITNEYDISVDVSVSPDKKSIMVAETVTLEQKNKDEAQIKIMVKMVGNFKVVGTPSVENLDEFGKINGAAILYPYIREHISSLSIKAGVNPIFLPPVNFSVIEK